MTAPMCRNCQHGVFPLGPSGKQIKRSHHGECAKQGELTTLALRMTFWPSIKVMVGKQVIWPTDKASKCTGFVRKGPTDS